MRLSRQAHAANAWCRPQIPKMRGLEAMKSHVRDAIERARGRLEYASKQREQLERDLSSTHQNFTDPRNQLRLRKLKEDEQRAQNELGG